MTSTPHPPSPAPPCTEPVELHTARLVLRPWRPSDWPAFAQLNADPEVMRHFPATLTADQTQAMVQRCQAGIDERGWGFWATEHRASGQLAGMIGLNVPSADLPCSPCVEIGWRLARPFWHQGLATEGARAALDFAFGTLQLDEVVAFTTLSNLPSQAVMQRLGMQRDAATFQHPALPPGHALAEHCLYRIQRHQHGV